MITKLRIFLDNKQVLQVHRKLKKLSSQMIQFKKMKLKLKLKLKNKMRRMKGMQPR